MVPCQMFLLIGVLVAEEPCVIDILEKPRKNMINKEKDHSWQGTYVSDGSSEHVVHV